MQNIPVNFFKVVATFANLRSLVLATCLHPSDFETLFTQLTALPLMSTLSLNLFFWEKDETAISLNNFWALMAQLKHPSLRRLFLYIDDEIEKWDKPHHQCEIPPLPILCQLISFFYGNEKLETLSTFYKVIRALTKEQHGAHLIPGVDACFTHFQLNLPEVSPIEPELLRYITDLHLEINDSDNHLPVSVRFFLFIPHMRNLRKIKLTMGMNMHPIHYPSFLKAVSSLTLLNELDITDRFLDINIRYTLNEMWPRTAMPVLSSVRFLSMFCLCLGHTPVIERYHLAHCFPGLRQLRCHFSHSTSCDLRDSDTNFKTCGQKLAQGLAELVPHTVQKEIEFKFYKNRKFFYFSSLEKLMAFNNENV